MIFYPYFELAASLFILFLAFETISRHSQNKPGRYFAILAMIAFLSAISEYSVRIALTLDIARNIHRITGVLWSFLFPTFTLFCLTFANKKEILKNRLTYLLLYGPAVFVASLFFFTNLMTTRYEIWPIGIVYQPAPWYWIYLIHTFVYVGIGVGILYHKALTSKQDIIRKQAIIIATGSLIALLIGGINDEFIPLVFGQRFLWPTAIFVLALMNAFVYYGMRRYSLFAISPWRVTETIIENMPDSLIVTDLEGRITLLNEEAHKYFHVPKEEILGRNIKSLFHDKEKFNQLYQEVVEKSLEIERFEAKLLDPLGECLPSLINAAVFHDSFGVALGIAFIIRDMGG